jgi:uncharacterized membrane protein HdeD (DUF308 family)
MLSMLKRNWWTFVVRGIAAIVFGVLAIVQPTLTLATLIILFGAYAIVDGVSMLIALVRGDPIARRNNWTFLIIGILGVLVGIGTLIWPGLTALSLLYFVAFWAIFVGVMQVMAAISLRREIQGELWLVLGGIVTIAFGVLLVLSPGTGLLSLIWLIGVWAVAFGVLSLVMAWRLRGLSVA